MTKHLVIVESPAKARTIKKYLGTDFEVMASYGHVRDLVPKEGAVNPELDFEMKYELISKNSKHVDAITKALKKADVLHLATDPDREGEAISWHLYEILKEQKLLEDKAVSRVVFHEITKRAVQDAVDNPRELAIDLINAQQARRALDYLVGFNLSPLLWRKIRRGLSAGRVQSPALRMIVEREIEIDAFKPREYWSIIADVEKESKNISAKLSFFGDEKMSQFSIDNDARATEVRTALIDSAGGKLTVKSIEKKQRKRNPTAPFITSTLQQEASRKLGFGAQRTMRIAQQLYEGIDIGDGAVGLITYMRTDSVNLAKEAVDGLRELIVNRYGKENIPDEPYTYKTKAKNAQEAHEAIRPTDPTNIPEEIKAHLEADQMKLYDLIWKRSVACQMVPALIDTVGVDLDCGGKGTFRATGSSIAKPGFMAVYLEGQDDAKADDDEKMLPPLVEGETLQLNEIAANQHFTEPPPRFSEASLVKALEEHGIGRPSTYASIISTLTSREYVELESRRFRPTDVGRIVNKFLTDHFTQYVDYDFTAKLEDDLDAVSRGEREWVPLMHQFWQPFKATVDEKAELSRDEVMQARILGTDPKSGRPISARLGRYGPLIQIGTKDDEEKPKFAALRNGQKLDTITLEEALELFKLPRTLGETADGETVSVNIGRFGPYVRFGSKFAPMKEDDPYTVELPRALELIELKKQADANKTIQIFEGTEIKVLRGRYGPYITDGNKNVKIPKDKEPEKLTLEECEALIAAAPEKKSRKKAAPKKAAAKKAPAKKAPAKKKTAAKKTTAKKKPAAKKSDAPAEK